MKNAYYNNVKLYIKLILKDYIFRNHSQAWDGVN